MKIFKSGTAKGELANKAAIKIANCIIWFQNGFAKSMFSFTKSWKQKQQWLFLYMVCLVFGGLSIIAIVNPFKIKEQDRTFIPKSISVPKSIQEQSEQFIITENEFQQVQEYKRKYPDLQKERPGLFDSLKLVEEMYYSQTK